MAQKPLRTDADFEAFYARHWKYVCRLCFTYMKSEADAEDCTEDVFVKVLTGDFSFEDAKMFLPSTMRIFPKLRHPKKKITAGFWRRS